MESVGRYPTRYATVTNEPFVNADVRVSSCFSSERFHLREQRNYSIVEVFAAAEPLLMNCRRQALVQLADSSRPASEVTHDPDATVRKSLKVN